MEWWQALILGLVEGITEYLPVSSTGHLILTAWLMGFSTSPAQWQAAFTFNIVIQAGAIAAVLGLYWARVKQIVRGVLGEEHCAMLCPNPPDQALRCPHQNVIRQNLRAYPAAQALA